MSKRLLAAVIGATALMGIGANAAFAGEITGNGKWIAGSPDAPLHGKSECAYSGQNDNFHLGVPLPDEDGFTRTQSWGQLDKEVRDFLTSIHVNPGYSCNPSRAG